MTPAKKAAPKKRAAKPKPKAEEPTPQVTTEPNPPSPAPQFPPLETKAPRPARGQFAV